MPRSPRPSSKAISTVVEDRSDPTLPVILEFQMPSTTITTAPVPRGARHVVWIVGSMLVVILAALGMIHVDRVVTAQGKVVARTPTLVLQPLEAAIVRSIDVHEGQTVRAGQVLAQLDPTFAAADVGALAAQVSSLQAQVSRLQAEADGQPFAYSGIEPNLALQAAIYGQRTADNRFAFGGRGANYHWGSAVDPAFERVDQVFEHLHAARSRIKMHVIATVVNGSLSLPVG